LSSLKYLPATIGTLVKLRERLQLVMRGKDVLEMRRDQLIKEIYYLLEEIKKREDLERELYRLYTKIKELFMISDPNKIHSYAKIVKKPRFRILYESLLGVKVPKIEILVEPDFTQISDPAIYNIAIELWNLLQRLFNITMKELAVESLTNELAYINRVVNSLEKSVIPQIKEQIHYVENRIQEESLGSFVRIKKVRDLLQKRREE